MPYNQGRYAIVIGSGPSKRVEPHGASGPLRGDGSFHHPESPFRSPSRREAASARTPFARQTSTLGFHHHGPKARCGPGRVARLNRRPASDEKADLAATTPIRPHGPLWGHSSRLGSCPVASDHSVVDRPQGAATARPFLHTRASSGRSHSGHQASQRKSRCVPVGSCGGKRPENRNFRRTVAGWLRWRRTHVVVLW